MHYLSISSIFKNENHHLQEWLDYHLQVGVEHFYLYNNDDNPTESDAILRPYIERGFAHNIHISGQRMQVPQMRSAMCAFKHSSRWLAFIDLDEFILPRACDDIKEILEDYELYSALAIHWTVFGSGDLLRRPPNQIDHYLYRAKLEHPINCHVKCIMNPALAIPEAHWHPHWTRYYEGHAVNEKYQHVPEWHDEYTGEIIRLNHYCCRSRQDWDEIKQPRPRCDTGALYDEERWLEVNLNDIYDDEISRRFGGRKEQSGEVT